MEEVSEELLEECYKHNINFRKDKQQQHNTINNNKTQLTMMFSFFMTPKGGKTSSLNWTADSTLEAIKKVKNTNDFNLLLVLEELDAAALKTFRDDKDVEVILDVDDAFFAFKNPSGCVHMICCYDDASKWLHGCKFDFIKNNNSGLIDLISPEKKEEEYEIMSTWKPKTGVHGLPYLTFEPRPSSYPELEAEETGVAKEAVKSEEEDDSIVKELPKLIDDDDVNSSFESISGQELNGVNAAMVKIKLEE